MIVDETRTTWLLGLACGHDITLDLKNGELPKRTAKCELCAALSESR